jgi:methylated-DNA-[protein]-cysteine S-methyltransferase
MPHLLFPTPLGICALAWNDAGITGLQLPEADKKATERKLAARTGSDGASSKAPDFVLEASAWVKRLLSGAEAGCFTAHLDWSQVTEFRRRVYEAAMGIPAGQTRSYGELARELGLKPGASRAVGQALGANPWPLLVPCHRVVAADGRLTGFSAYGGVATKARILSLEGAELPGFPI